MAPHLEITVFQIPSDERRGLFVRNRGKYSRLDSVLGDIFNSYSQETPQDIRCSFSCSQNK